MSGYEGEGTGGGWGNWGGRDDDAPGSGWAGKPGESAMAQAGAKDATGRAGTMSDQELADAGISVDGLNPMNSSQTVEQMEASQKFNDLLSWGVPTAASAMVPALGLINTIGRVGTQLKSGVPAEDIVAGLLPGYINGKINQATGGLYGNVAKYGGILNSLTGSPQVPNIGREIVGGIMGRQPGGTGTTSPSTAMASAAAPDGNGGDTTVAQQPATAATSAPAAPAQDDVDYASLGIDSAGWTTAGRNYLEKRHGMV